MRTAAKRDALEPAVVAVAQDRGWMVMRLDKFDLLCHHPHFGITLMVEVKSGPKKKLTPSQQMLLLDGWPLKIVRSEEEAVDLFNIRFGPREAA